MVDAYELIRQAASPVQWWLSFWLLVSLLFTPALMFFMQVMDYLGGWPVGNG
jgi:hypothetical protein